MSFELPPEMLNRVNRQLRQQVQEAEERLQRLKYDRAEADLSVQDHEEKLGRFHRKIEEWNRLVEAVAGRVEAERRHLKTLEREIHKAQQEQAVQGEREAQLGAGIAGIDERAAARKAAIRALLSSMRMSQEQLDRVLARQHTVEDEAEMLAKMTDVEAAEYQRLVASRDSLLVDVHSKKSQLEAEMEVAEGLRKETLETLKQAGQLTAERAATVDLVSQMVDMQQAIDVRTDGAADALKAVHQQRASHVARKHELVRLQEEEEGQSKQLRRLVEAHERKRAGLSTRHVDARRGAEDAGLQVRSVEEAVLAAAEELSQCRAELEQGRARLETGVATYGTVEAELHRLQQDHLFLQQQQLSDEARLAKLNDYREETIRRLNRTIQQAQKLRSTLGAEYEVRDVTRALRKELDMTVEVKRKLNAKQQHDVAALDQRSNEYTSALRSLDAVRELKADVLQRTKGELQAYRDELVERGLRLREELTEAEQVAQPLLAQLAGLNGLIQQTQQQVMLQQTQQAEVAEEAALLQKELQALGKAVAEAAAERQQKESETGIMRSAVEGRARPKVLAAIEGVQAEEERKLELLRELKEREVDIRRHQDSLRYNLRMQEEERGSLRIELNTKQGSIALLQSRYEEVMNAIHAAASMHDEDVGEGEGCLVRKEEIATIEPEEIQARYLASLASMRMTLQDRGDHLDSTLTKISKSNQQLDRALGKLTAGTTQYKEEIGKIAYNQPTNYELVVARNKGVGEAAEKTAGELAAIRQHCADTQGEIDETLGTLFDQQRQHTWLQKQLAVKRKQLRKYETLRERLISDYRQAPPPRPESARQSTDDILRTLQHWAVSTASTSPDASAFYQAYRRTLDKFNLQPKPAGMVVGKKLSWGTPDTSPASSAVPPPPSRPAWGEQRRSTTRAKLPPTRKPSAHGQAGLAVTGRRATRAASSSRR